MIKSALKIYGKNIWNVFAVIGFVSLGIFIGLFVIVPVINNLLYSTYNHIVSAATNLGQGFSLKAFIDSINNQFYSLDWSNPVRTIHILFEEKGIYNIIITGLRAANLKEDQIIVINDIIVNQTKNLITGLKSELLIFAGCVLVTSMIGYVATKIVVQIKSTYDHHILRFIGSFFTNLAILALVYFLIILTLVSITGVGVTFALIGILLMMLLLTFLSAILFYKKKEVKFFEIFNLKTNLKLLLSCLIIFAISAVIIIILFLISDVIAILVVAPLVIVTMIIIENAAISFVSSYKPSEPEEITPEEPAN